MSEEVIATTTAWVDLEQLTKAVMAVCAMIEAAVEQYDDASTGFNEGMLALGNEMKTYADYIYNAVIESSKTISLTTKIRIKSEIDKLDSLIDAYEQVMNKQSNNKKGVDDEDVAYYGVAFDKIRGKLHTIKCYSVGDDVFEKKLYFLTEDAAEESIRDCRSDWLTYLGVKEDIDED